MQPVTVKFKDLTKKEMKHLRTVANVRTLTAFKETAAHQATCRANGEHEPCYECKFIAVKLGLPV